MTIKLDVRVKGNKQEVKGEGCTFIYGVLVLNLFLFFGCIFKEGDNRLKLKNNTKDTIYYQWNIHDSLDLVNRIVIKDSIKLQKLKDTVSKYYTVYPDRVLPDSIISLSQIAGWEGVLYDNSKKIWIFILDQTTVENYSWDSIVKYQSYKSRIEFTYDDLKNKRWVINYPNIK